MSAGSETSTWTADDDDKLVRPKAELCSLLQHVGATKEVFTMKEVMFYLGQYILQKQLYDQRQQHFVHCGQDALGQVLGVDSFSMKEPQVLFAMITKNLVAVRNQESTSLSEPHGSSPMDRGTESGRSEVRVTTSDSDSDNFSVEYELESTDSSDYNEDDHSLSADDDEVYEVTVFEVDDDDDSFDEDTEVTEADFCCCAKCNELNPPLHRNGFLCWTLRQERPLESSIDCTASGPKAPPTMPASQSAAREAPAAAARPTSVPAEWRLPDSCLDPCLICQSRPKNGCIVHGRTGHLMCCYVCARKLKKRNKPCPVCRLPIQSVILTYLS